MSIKTKRILCIIPLLLCIVLFVSVCLAHRKPARTALDALAPQSELKITPSKKQVAAFEAQNVDFESPYDADECYNITPDFVADHSDYMIFKYEESNETFILYDGKVYRLNVTVQIRNPSLKQHKATKYSKRISLCTETFNKYHNIPLGTVKK